MPHFEVQLRRTITYRVKVIAADITDAGNAAVEYTDELIEDDMSHDPGGAGLRHQRVVCDDALDVAEVVPL